MQLARTWAVDIDGTITLDHDGTVHLGALGALRRLAASGDRVVYVTGRSSVEAFILSIFGGTGRVAVGENGGCITLEAGRHIMLGDIGECRRALDILRSRMDNIREKAVFPRMTEVVLERTFDIGRAQDMIRDMSLPVALTDSGYAFHINSVGVDKGRGLHEIMSMYGISPGDVIAIGDSATDVPMFGKAATSIALGNASETVHRHASMSVEKPAGEGLLEALNILGAAI